MSFAKRVSEYIFISFCAFISAFNYIIFVFPNKFAPAGVDGVCTMIQDITGISMELLVFACNLPLLIAAYRILSRDFALKNIDYTVSFFLYMALLKSVDLSRFVYYTETGTSIIYAPIVAGVIRGILYAITLKMGGASGGSDLIAALIKHKRPYLELMNVIFTINMCIAMAAYFVYGYKLEPVICSIIYSFIISTVSRHVQKTANAQVRYEIITPNYEEMCHEMLEKCDTTSTILESRGAFTGTVNQVVLCIVDKKKAPYIEEIINSYPGTVIFKSEVDNHIVGTSYK